MRGGKKVRNFLSIIIIFTFLAAMFSGCTFLQKLGLGKAANDEIQPVSSIAINESESKALMDKIPVDLYFTNEDGSKLKMEVRYIPITYAKRSADSLATKLVNELINGPGENSSLKATIPEGTKQLSRVSINLTEGVATVNLTREFVNNQSDKINDERLTIYSIVNTLTELKEIQKVSFLVNNERLAEYKGNFKFDSPFPRTTSLISKEAASTAGSGNSPTVTPKATTGNAGDQKDNSSDSIDTFNNPQESPEEFNGVPLE